MKLATRSPNEAVAAGRFPSSMPNSLWECLPNSTLVNLGCPGLLSSCQRVNNERCPISKKANSKAVHEAARKPKGIGHTGAAQGRRLADTRAYFD